MKEIEQNIIEEMRNSTPKEVKLFVQWYGDIIDAVNEAVINNHELRYRQMVTDVYNGDFDFSLRGIAKLSVELGHDLIKINTPERNDIQ